MEALKGRKCRTALAVHMINRLAMAMSWYRRWTLRQFCGAASHCLLFNLFNLFWLLLSMTFNVKAQKQCSCHLVKPPHGWHISVLIVLASHSLLKTGLHASMARFSETQTYYIYELTPESILKLAGSTRTPALWLKAVWRTPLRAALLRAKHGTLGSTTWASNFGFGDQKPTIFIGFYRILFWCLCILKGNFILVSLGHDMTSTPKILASPGSSWPLCCL